MLSKEKLARLNLLAKESKIRELVDEEKYEQQQLRKEYISSFRKSFKKQLEGIEFTD